MIEIAALYVDRGGAYFDLDGVDPWDVDRDARGYDGPAPVVAHPPCGRWIAPLAYVNQTRYGHKVGEDGGCFAHALASVRRFGGVLEHPSTSIAFREFGLPRPNPGSWQATECGGFVTRVDQLCYGHKARKRTYLYARSRVIPDLDWRTDLEPTHTVSWLQRTSIKRPRISKREASRTPERFRDLLLTIARGSLETSSRPDSSPQKRREPPRQCAFLGEGWIS